MLNSMTGYGKSLVTHGEKVIETEIKSFNSRFLDISIKLPRELSSKEFEIREIIKSNIQRGKFFVSITENSSSSDNIDSLLDEQKLSATFGLLEKIKSLTKIDDNISLDDLISLKDNFLLHKQEEEKGDETYEYVTKGVIEALEELKKMRSVEGAVLKSDLTQRIDKIEKYLENIEGLNRESVVDHFDKLKSRAKQLSEEILGDDIRLKMELAILVEKYDISEECVRLGSHLKLFRDTMEISGDSGRKLNFISQEINREVNTINSKTLSTDISHLGILIKEELEKIREQIQNIE